MTCKRLSPGDEMTTEQSGHIQASPAMNTRSWAEKCDATRCPTVPWSRTLSESPVAGKEEHSLMYIVHHSIGVGQDILYGAKDLRATCERTPGQRLSLRHGRLKTYIHDLLGAHAPFVKSPGLTDVNFGELNVQADLHMEVEGRQSATASSSTHGESRTVSPSRGIIMQLPLSE